MVREMDPNKTSRAAAYRLWMDAPNPMVTFMKTLDVTNLVKLSRRRGLKFNMLLDWCIGKAAAGIESAGCMVIGTSAIVDTELDGAVGMHSGIYNNPFLIWGRYRKKLFRYRLPLSFQFHHTQMDGAQAGRFLEELQNEIRQLAL